MKIFENETFHSHMPFFFDNDTILFCTSPQRNIILEDQGRRAFRGMKTKTYYRDYTIVIGKYSIIDGQCKITDMKNVTPDGDLNDVYCNPHMWVDKNGNYVLNYIKMDVGGVKHRFRYMERKAKAIDELRDTPGRMVLDNLGFKPYSSFDNIKYRCSANVIKTSPRFMIYNKEEGFQQDYIIGGTTFLKRVSFDYTNIERVLLTYVDYRGKYATSIYNIKDNTILKINSELPVYKATIHKEAIVFSNGENQGENYKMSLFSSKYKLGEDRFLKVTIGKKISRPYLP